jgi:hypothetical protein
MGSNPDLEAVRLCFTADAILEAFWQMAPKHPDGCPYPPDLLKTNECPPCLAGHSYEELAEATNFLLRLGLLARL